MNFYTKMQKTFRIKDHNWQELGSTKKDVTDFLKWVHAKKGLTGQLEVSNVGLVYGTNGTDHYAFGCVTDVNETARRCSHPSSITCKLTFISIDTDGKVLTGLSKSTALSKMPLGKKFVWKFIPQTAYNKKKIMQQDTDELYREEIANAYLNAYDRFGDKFAEEVKKTKEYYEQECIVAKLKHDSRRHAVCSHKVSMYTDLNIMKSIFGLIIRHDGSHGFMTPQLLARHKPGLAGVMAMNRNKKMYTKEFIYEYLAYALRTVRERE